MNSIFQAVAFKLKITAQDHAYHVDLADHFDTDNTEQQIKQSMSIKSKQKPNDTPNIFKTLL